MPIFAQTDPVQEADQEPYPINLSQVKLQIGYPQAAREQGIQGSVVVKILVDTSGAYVSHTVAESPDTALSAAVEAAIPSLRFTPALRSGKPIPFWVSVPFAFTLINEQPAQKQKTSIFHSERKIYWGAILLTINLIILGATDNLHMQ